MSQPVEAAEVLLWGVAVGVVAWDGAAGLAAFEYTPEFQRSGIELAPLQMPLGPRIHSFPELSRESYRGLPGLLADSLPDRFGTLLINQWVQRRGRTVESFTPIEHLCYLGRRGMGALEFEPAAALGRQFEDQRSADSTGGCSLSVMMTGDHSNRPMEVHIMALRLCFAARTDRGVERGGFVRV